MRELKDVFKSVLLGVFCYKNQRLKFAQKHFGQNGDYKNILPFFLKLSRKRCIEVTNNSKVPTPLAGIRNHEPGESVLPGVGTVSSPRHRLPVHGGLPRQGSVAHPRDLLDVPAPGNGPGIDVINQFTNKTIIMCNIG
jgi:hypothetical protein